MRSPYRPSALRSAIATFLPFFGLLGNLTAEASSSCDTVPLTFGFFATGLLEAFGIGFAFLRVPLTSSSSALSKVEVASLASSSSSSSTSDALFSTSFPDRFLFAVTGRVSGANFSGILTARPDLRRLAVATGLLIASVLNISVKGFLRAVIDSLDLSWEFAA
jgi:hypothetical protein